MTKLLINMEGGPPVEVAGRRFSHYVNGVQFWFFLHKEIGGRRTVVTHWVSGKRVLFLTDHSLAACLGDEKAAAKMEIDVLVARLGGDRVRFVLSSQEPGK